jgi:hypothetical protein
MLLLFDENIYVAVEKTRFVLLKKLIRNQLRLGKRKQMRFKLFTVLYFLFLLTVIIGFILPVHADPSIDSWVDINVVSFNGENILFDLEVTVRGDHTGDSMHIKIEPTSGSTSEGGFATVFIEVFRGVSEVVYHSGDNVTVFSYFYSYNHTYYNPEPKFVGQLLFPWDKHDLTLYLEPSFNISMDEHPKICSLPSQNYEGSFQVRFTPDNQRPTLHVVTLSIQHSKSFSDGVFAILWIPLFFLYGLSVVLMVLIALIFFRKKNIDNLSNIVRVSSAVLFFVPAFEIAFYNLKSPLPFVFSDTLMILLIPAHVTIICCALILLYKRR